MHNPTAGEGHSERDELIGAIESAEYRVEYRSKEEEDFDGAEGFSQLDPLPAEALPARLVICLHPAALPVLTD